jgi:hypothetical protein
MASVPGVPSSRIPSMWKRIASRMFFSASSTELLDAFEQQLFQAKKSGAFWAPPIEVDLFFSDQ